MSVKDVPESHPRYLSLTMRETIVQGVEIGITSMHGLIAHGRGEAFNYLLGEKTQDFALQALRVAAAKLCLAKHPLISVNGNAAALAAEDLIKLSEISGAPLEVNIFHTSSDREKKIAEHLLSSGARGVLLPQTDCILPGIDSNRKFIHPEGIAKADLVFVPLEDGDRCEALIKSRREVVTVDLNPVSRTAKTATVTIVDDLSRTLPLLVDLVREYKTQDKSVLAELIDLYDNEQVLKEAREYIARHFVNG